jgi:hypothetical protein
MRERRSHSNEIHTPGEPGDVRRGLYLCDRRPVNQASATYRTISNCKIGGTYELRALRLCAQKDNRAIFVRFAILTVKTRPVTLQLTYTWSAGVGHRG